MEKRKTTETQQEKIINEDNLDWAAISMVLEENWDEFVQYCNDDNNRADQTLDYIQKKAGMK